MSKSSSKTSVRGRSPGRPSRNSRNRWDVKPEIPEMTWVQPKLTCDEPDLTSHFVSTGFLTCFAFQPHDDPRAKPHDVSETTNKVRQYWHHEFKGHGDVDQTNMDAVQTDTDAVQTDMDASRNQSVQTLDRLLKVVGVLFKRAIPRFETLVFQWLVVLAWLYAMRMHWPCLWLNTDGKANCATYCDFHGTKWVNVFVLALALALHFGLEWSTHNPEHHRNESFSKLGLLAVIFVGWWGLSYMTSLWSTLLSMVILLFVVAYGKAVTLGYCWPTYGHCFLMVPTISLCLFLTCVVSVIAGYHASADFHVINCTTQVLHDTTVMPIGQLLQPDMIQDWANRTEKCVDQTATLPSTCDLTKTPSLLFAGSHAWTHQMDSYFPGKIFTTLVLGLATAIVCYVTKTIRACDAVIVFCVVCFYPLFTRVCDSHNLVSRVDLNNLYSDWDNVKSIQETSVVSDVLCVLGVLFWMGYTYWAGCYRSRVST